MYYKSLGDDISYNFGESYYTWLKSPVGIAVIAAIILLIVIGLWMYFGKEKHPGYAQIYHAQR